MCLTETPWDMLHWNLLKCDARAEDFGVAIEAPTSINTDCTCNRGTNIHQHCIIDKFVPFQKQGKRCRKKHLSKEAIRKIMLKQTMWRVYRRTRKDEDYAKYKEALNAATTEIRQSKRSYEQKLACNIQQEFLCICQE